MKKESIVDSLLQFNDNISYVFNENMELIFEYSLIEEIDKDIIINKIKTLVTGEISIFTMGKYKLKINRIIIEKTILFTVIIFEFNSKPYSTKQSLEYIKYIIDQIPSGIAFAQDKKIIYRNKRMIEILQLELKEKLIQPDEVLTKDFKQIIFQLISGKLVGQQEIHVQFKNHPAKWVLVENGFFNLLGIEYTILFILDITKQKEIELEFKRKQEQLGYAFESINDSVIITDQDDCITLFNKESEYLTGYSKEEALGKKIKEVVSALKENEDLFNYLDLDEFNNPDIILQSKEDLFRHVVFKKSIVKDEFGNNYGNVFTITDVSSSKRKEKEILYLSYHDVLTGLHNRTFFEEQLILLDTERQYPLSVIMGDVNGLKLTNDVFGHDAGDRLLKNFAQVFKSTCRHEDVIARWGGDEFIVLLPKTNEQQVNIIMNRIIGNIDKVYKTDKLTSILPSLSLGYGIKYHKHENIYDALKTAENNMYKRKMLTSSSVYSSIITSMKKSLYERSNETEEHAERLFATCKKVAEKYKITTDEMNELELFAVLHDIGKIGISDKILNKKHDLTDEEWDIMKTHPEIGYRIALASKELKGVGEYILSHHERFDGTGYPRGLKGYEIPLLSRILSVADAFDAMTNDRSYQKARSKKFAIKELTKYAGTQFDPKVVKIFIEEYK